MIMYNDFKKTLNKSARYLYTINVDCNISPPQAAPKNIEYILWARRRRRKKEYIL